MIFQYQSFQAELRPFLFLNLYNTTFIIPYFYLNRYLNSPYLKVLSHCGASTDIFSKLLDFFNNSSNDMLYNLENQGRKFSSSDLDRPKDVHNQCDEKRCTVPAQEGIEVVHQ